jgi:hypothetical protein
MGIRMNTSKWLKQMMPQPYFKVRVAVAALLVPVAPLLTLWIASLGKAAGERVAHRFMVEAMNHPWLLVVIAAVPMALFTGLLVMLFSEPGQPKNRV